MSFVIGINIFWPAVSVLDFSALIPFKPLREREEEFANAYNFQLVKKSSWLSLFVNDKVSVKPRPSRTFN